MEEIESLRREDDRRMTSLEKYICDLGLDIRNIKENHLAHIERDVSTLGTDVEWLKRFFWLIVTSSLGAFIGTVITAIMQFV